MIHKTINKSIYENREISYKTFLRFMVRGTTKGLASHNTRSPNVIHNKMKDCYHNEKLPRTPCRKYEDEVSPE